MEDNAPYHAHIYFEAGERAAAEALRDEFKDRTGPDSDPHILFIGRMIDGRAGPHPIPQYEVHFRESSLEHVLHLIESSGLRALVHPLTDDDLADHTTLAHWVGEPHDLDLATLDPAGMNQGVPRFGIRDF